MTCLWARHIPGHGELLPAQGRVVCEGILLRVVLSDVAFLGGIFERIQRLTVKSKVLAWGDRSGLVWSFGAERGGKLAVLLPPKPM